jgi:hypothetical protein
MTVATLTKSASKPTASFSIQMKTMEKRKYSSFLLSPPLFPCFLSRPLSLSFPPFILFYLFLCLASIKDSRIQYGPIISLDHRLCLRHNGCPFSSRHWSQDSRHTPAWVEMDPATQGVQLEEPASRDKAKQVKAILIQLYLQVHRHGDCRYPHRVRIQALRQLQDQFVKFKNKEKRQYSVFLLSPPSFSCFLSRLHSLSPFILFYLVPCLASIKDSRIQYGRIISLDHRLCLRHNGCPFSSRHWGQDSRHTPVPPE